MELGLVPSPLGLGPAPGLGPVAADPLLSGTFSCHLVSTYGLLTWLLDRQKELHEVEVSCIVACPETVLNAIQVQVLLESTCTYKFVTDSGEAA